MALQFISAIPVYVTDQDRARDFFVEKVGFSVGQDEQFGEGMRWLEVHTPEGKAFITILKASDYGMESIVGKNTGLVFYSDDVRGAVEEMRAKGVKITEDANEQMWGVQAQFEDPDGNGFVIVGK